MDELSKVADDVEASPGSILGIEILWRKEMFSIFNLTLSIQVDISKRVSQWFQLQLAASVSASYCYCLQNFPSVAMLGARHFILKYYSSYIFLHFGKKLYISI